MGSHVPNAGGIVCIPDQLFQLLERLGLLAIVAHTYVYQLTLLPWRRSEFRHLVHNFDSTMACFEQFMDTPVHNKSWLRFH